MQVQVDAAGDVTRLDPEVLRLALIAAQGDTTRLEVIDARTVLVR